MRKPYLPSCLVHITQKKETHSQKKYKQTLITLNDATMNQRGETMDNNNNTNILWNNKWIWTAILFVGAMILSACKFVELPDGGAITYCSLLLLWLITYFFGFKHGLVFSILFGFAKFFITYATNEYINYEVWALILEYPLASGVFCLGGLIRTKKTTQATDKITIYNIPKESVKLTGGYLIGVFGQFIFYVISAVLFYPPNKQGFLPNLWYCIVYDGSYLLIEAVFTVILINIPPVTEAINYVKYVATHDNLTSNTDYF